MTRFGAFSRSSSLRNSSICFNSNSLITIRRQLRLARILTFTYGVIVIALAFLVERLGTLLEATNKVISLVGGPLIGLFLLGMMFSRANARGALAGWAAGFVATLWFAFGTKISFLWWAAYGAAVTVGVGLAASLLDGPEQRLNPGHGGRFGHLDGHLPPDIETGRGQRETAHDRPDIPGFDENLFVARLGVNNTTAKKLKQFAEKNPDQAAPKTFFDYRKMLEECKGDIDVVLIATPDHHHAPAAIRAIDLGKAVFCQKPLAHNIYELLSEYLDISTVLRTYL